MLSKKVKQLEDRFDLVCKDYKEAIGKIARLESMAEIREHLLKEQGALIKKLTAEIKRQKEVIDYQEKVANKKSGLADFAVWAYNTFQDRPTKDAAMIMRKLKQMNILK